MKKHYWIYILNFLYIVVCVGIIWLIPVSIFAKCVLVIVIVIIFDFMKKKLLGRKNKN